MGFNSLAFWKRHQHWSLVWNPGRIWKQRHSGWNLHQGSGQALNLYALYSFSAKALPCFSNQSKLGRDFLCLSMFVHFFSQNLVWPPFAKAYEDLKHSIEKLGASLEKVWNDLNEMKVKYGKFEQAMEASTWKLPQRFLQKLLHLLSKVFQKDPCTGLMGRRENTGQKTPDNRKYRRKESRADGIHEIIKRKSWVPMAEYRYFLNTFKYQHIYYVSNM